MQTHIITYSARNLLTKGYNTYSTDKYKTIQYFSGRLTLFTMRCLHYMIEGNLKIILYKDRKTPKKTASCGIENFEFIASELVQVNPDNSRAKSALTSLLFKLNTLQTQIVKLESAEVMVE